MSSLIFFIYHCIFKHAVCQTISVSNTRNFQYIAYLPKPNLKVSLQQSASGSTQMKTLILKLMCQNRNFPHPFSAHGVDQSQVQSLGFHTWFQSSSYYLRYLFCFPRLKLCVQLMYSVIKESSRCSRLGCGGAYVQDW